MCPQIEVASQRHHSQKLETIGRLATEIAHEFKNLQCVIAGYSDLVLRSLGEDHRAASDVEEIKKANERAISLTRQLLDYSRRETAEGQILDVNVIVQDVSRMLQRLFRNDIEVVVNVQAEYASIRSGPAQIEQLLVNLVLNARDAMPDGGKVLIQTVNVDTGDDSNQGRLRMPRGRHVMLSVSDTGCGIDRVTLPRVFEPFFTTKEPGKGTGLGLATVYETVERCGGHIEVQTEVGVGTTIRIILPCVAQELPAVDSAASQHISTSHGEIVRVMKDDDRSQAAVLGDERLAHAHAA